jgi:hypothetical protein
MNDLTPTISSKPSKAGCLVQCKCNRCHRTLKNEKSIRIGLGFVCAKKMHKECYSDLNEEEFMKKVEQAEVDYSRYVKKLIVKTP